MGRFCRIVGLAAVAAMSTGCTPGPVEAPGVPMAPTLAAASPVASPKVKLPPVGVRPDYQLGGAYAPSSDVRIVTRDRTAKPAPGRYGICYVNAYQTQPGEEATWQGTNADLVLRDPAGKPVVDSDWGEQLLDTSTAAKRTRLAAIVGGWIDGCARSGFEAVEPDNLDSWTRSDGLLTELGNLAFAELLIGRAHADGLAIAQKNAAEISAKGRKIGFDFAVAEECQVWKECGSYTHAYGRHVIEIEYNDQPKAAFTKACNLRGGTASIVRRDRDLVAKGRPGYYARWC